MLLKKLEKTDRRIVEKSIRAERGWKRKSLLMITRKNFCHVKWTLVKLVCELMESNIIVPKLQNVASQGETRSRVKQ